MGHEVRITREALDRGLFLISGPCVIEDMGLLRQVAETLCRIEEESGAIVIFKSSYDKANRTSRQGFRGPGLQKGLEMLVKIREEFGLPVLSDVHSVEEAREAGAVLDVLQIPAFLCRQTDLILAACESRAWVNIKKGQFLAPWDMRPVVEKCGEHAKKLLLTERGSCFGYNTLVNDMRSIPLMAANGVPVVFDGTHSVQKPGGRGDSTGGEREFVATLSKAAVAAGADGLFWEAHPDPDKAPSDGPNMLHLHEVAGLFGICRELYRVTRQKVGSKTP